MGRGFVYLLVNPSLEGLVKVGKTSRTPANRVAELSSATGVPTPFQLIYFAEFEDCDAAEQELHTLFTQRHARVSENREFFRIQIHEAVAALVALQQASAAPLGELPEDAAGARSSESSVVDTLLHNASCYYYGDEGRFQDTGRAIGIYKSAATLGSIDACIMLGLIYQDDGEGFDLRESKRYLMRGAELGSAECFAKLGAVFLKLGENTNAVSAWRRFYERVTEFNAHSRGQLSFDCIVQIAKEGLDRQLLPFVRLCRDDVAIYLTERQNKANGVEAIDRCRAMRDLAAYVLDGIPFPKQLTGTVKWFNEQKGFGFISTRDGTEYFLDVSELLTPNKSPNEGDAIQFQPSATAHGPVALNAIAH